MQGLKDKPWKYEELQKEQGAQPRVNESDLEKASRLQKPKTGVGCDGFHSKVHLDLTRETRGEVVEFL